MKTFPIPSSPILVFNKFHNVLHIVRLFIVLKTPSFTPICANGERIFAVGGYITHNQLIWARFFCATTGLNNASTVRGFWSFPNIRLTFPIVYGSIVDYNGDKIFSLSCIPLWMDLPRCETVQFVGLNYGLSGKVTLWPSQGQSVLKRPSYYFGSIRSFERFSSVTRKN